MLVYMLHYSTDYKLLNIVLVLELLLFKQLTFMQSHFLLPGVQSFKQCYSASINSSIYRYTLKDTGINLLLSKHS